MYGSDISRRSKMASQFTSNPYPFNPRGLLPSKFYPRVAIAATLTGALLPTLFGLGVYRNPQLALNSLNIPTPENEDDKNKIHALFRLSSAREMAFGVATMGIWWFSARKGNWSGYRSLGVALLAKAVMKVSDGKVILDLMGGGQWTHWCFVLPDLLMGAALLELI
jgi:hypothetical protein